ncbi:hypothetical protein CWC22_022865 [Pseudoalteromonas rubra]|uniref:Uncharacterized protein n=1 Tax=Pseudoalteromonas rubra TaxID=43658 RepID=A0A5S3V2S0_9GAMM|nr:hypothetical protein [Pseudoalteromonas rubra]QPB85845.1 hypothetical protein CWC22_022865 [Pseudoalteromonas rubra]
MEECNIPEDITNLVNGLIKANTADYEIVKSRYLKEEDEQHDDQLIASIMREYSVLLGQFENELKVEFGTPKIVDDLAVFDDAEENEEEGGYLAEEDDEGFYVPCSFYSVIWEKEEYILFLAVCQEDREFPIELIVGVEF